MNLCGRHRPERPKPSPSLRGVLGSDSSQRTLMNADRCDRCCPTQHWVTQRFCVCLCICPSVCPQGRESGEHPAGGGRLGADRRLVRRLFIPGRNGLHTEEGCVGWGWGEGGGLLRHGNCLTGCIQGNHFSGLSVSGQPVNSQLNTALCEGMRG